MPEDMRFMFNGKPIDKEAAANYSVLAVGSFIPEENTAYVFDLEDAFYDWAMSTEYADKSSRIKEGLIEARARQGLDNSLVEKTQKRVVKRIADDLRDLANRLNLDKSTNVGCTTMAKKWSVSGDRRLFTFTKKWP
jgi:hypothetical protein